MREVERLLRVLDGAHRLGASGSLSVNFEGTEETRDLHVSRFVEEVGIAISHELLAQNISGAKLDQQLFGYLVAVGIEKGLKVLFRRADEIERTDELGRNLDALEAQQSLEASKAR